MKKIIVATMMLATAGIMQSMQEVPQEIQAQPRSRSLQSRLVSVGSRQLKETNTQAVLAAVAFHFYRNGVACPLTKNAQAPAALGAAVVAGRTAYNYFEQPVVKYGATAACAAVGVMALLQAKK